MCKNLRVRFILGDKEFIGKIIGTHKSIGVISKFVINSDKGVFFLNDNQLTPVCSDCFKDLKPDKELLYGKCSSCTEAYSMIGDL